MSKKNKGKMTTIERMQQLRKELDLEKKKSKKKTKSGSIINIDIKKMSKKKRKFYEKRLNPDLVRYYDVMDKETRDQFWFNYDQFDKFFNFEEALEALEREEMMYNKKDQYIDSKLSDIDPDSIDDLMKIDKIVHEKFNKARYKKYKKLGYEIGEDDILYINEDKLIDSLKRRRKEFRKINDRYRDYLDSVLGEDSKYAVNLDHAERKVDKKVKDLIKSFEAVAIESSIFRLK